MNLSAAASGTPPEIVIPLRCWAEGAGLSRRCWRLDGCQRWMSNVFLPAVPGWFPQCAGESKQPWPGGTINATVCRGKRGKCTWIWSTGGRQEHSLLHFDIRTWNLFLTSEHDPEMPVGFFSPHPLPSMFLFYFCQYLLYLKFWLACFFDQHYNKISFWPVKDNDGSCIRSKIN